MDEMERLAFSLWPGLCQLRIRHGVTFLRMSLPYNVKLKRRKLVQDTYSEWNPD
jgi:hypothetical protein